VRNGAELIEDRRGGQPPTGYLPSLLGLRELPERVSIEDIVTNSASLFQNGAMMGSRQALPGEKKHCGPTFFQTLRLLVADRHDNRRRIARRRTLG
jgi:hypothetical protein